MLYGHSMRRLPIAFAIANLAACSDPAGGPDASQPGPVDASTDAGLEMLDCSETAVRCVDDTAGETAEYPTVSAALAGAGPGHTVQVFAGSYDGFQIDTSGTANAPLRVRGLTGARIERGGPTGDGVRLENVSYVIVEGFHVLDPTARCVAARGATAQAPMVGNQVRAITCESSGLEGFYLSQFSRGAVVGNHIARTGRAGGTRDHGIYLANAGSDGTELRGNVIVMDGSTAESAGIHFNGDASIGGDGLISDLVVEDNTISGLVHNAFNLDGVERSRFANNLVYATMRHGLRGYAIDGAAGPQGLHIVNNTFVVAGTATGVRLTEDRGGHVIFNNILVVAAAGESISLESADRAMLGPNATDVGGPTVATLSLFRDAAALDFELAASSPAIGAGVATFAGVVAPAADRLGRPRTGNDLGAFRAP